MKIKISQSFSSKELEPSQSDYFNELESAIESEFKMNHEKYDSMKTDSNTLIRNILVRFPFIPPTAGYHPALDYNYLEMSALAGRHFLSRMKRIEAEYFLKCRRAARDKEAAHIEFMRLMKLEIENDLHVLKILEGERRVTKALFEKVYHSQLSRNKMFLDKWSQLVNQQAESLQRQKNALDQQISIERHRIEWLTNQHKSLSSLPDLLLDLSLEEMLETSPLAMSSTLLKLFRTYQGEYLYKFCQTESSIAAQNSFRFLSAKLLSRKSWLELDGLSPAGSYHSHQGISSYQGVDAAWKAKVHRFLVPPNGFLSPNLFQISNLSALNIEIFNKDISNTREWNTIDPLTIKDAQSAYKKNQNDGKSVLSHHITHGNDHSRVDYPKSIYFVNKANGSQSSEDITNSENAISTKNLSYDVQQKQANNLPKLLLEKGLVSGHEGSDHRSNSRPQIDNMSVKSTSQFNDQNHSPKNVVMKNGELETILKDHIQAPATKISKKTEAKSDSALSPQDEILAKKYAKG